MARLYSLNVEIEKTNGQRIRVGARFVEAMRMRMDWQIRDAGYTPESVRAALRNLDGEIERAEQLADEAERAAEDDWRERCQD